MKEPNRSGRSCSGEGSIGHKVLTRLAAGKTGPETVGALGLSVRRDFATRQSNLLTLFDVDSLEDPVAVPAAQPDPAGGAR